MPAQVAFENKLLLHVAMSEQHVHLLSDQWRQPGAGPSS